MIQTSCFILFGFVDPDPLFYFGVNMLDPFPSLPLWLDCGLEGHAVQLLAAASLLLAAAQLEHFGSRPVTKIWSKSAYPVPDLVPHRSRPFQTFYESGRSRRADHRGTFQTRLLMHSHVVPRLFRGTPSNLNHNDILI